MSFTLDFAGDTLKLLHAPALTLTLDKHGANLFCDGVYDKTVSNIQNRDHRNKIRHTQQIHDEFNLVYDVLYTQVQPNLWVGDPPDFTLVIDDNMLYLHINGKRAMRLTNKDKLKDLKSTDIFRATINIKDT